jgi:hypothetical protein
MKADQLENNTWEVTVIVHKEFKKESSDRNRNERTKWQIGFEEMWN